MLSSISIAALAMPLLALAAPAPDASNQQFLITVHVPKPAHPSSHSHFEGTYLEFYHTGAGTNDVALAPTSKNSELAYINKTDGSLLFKGGDFNYALDFYPITEYTSWQPVTINPGASDTQFFINSTGIQAKDQEFGGWVVCDWWHGVPQLFHYFKGYQTKLSQNCEFVQLLPAYPPKA